MKIYGEITEVMKEVVNENNVTFYTVKLLDSDQKELKCYLGRDDLQVGQRVATYVGKENKGVHFINSNSNIKVYEDKSKKASDKQLAISTLHANNGANILLANSPPSSPEIIEKAKIVHDVTRRINSEIMEANPDMDAFTAGNEAGNAVINGCRVCCKANKISEDDLYKFSMQFVNNITPAIREYVKENL